MGLERILKDEFEVDSNSRQNQPIFDSETDYASIIANSDLALEKWKELGEERQKQEFGKDFKKYCAHNGVENPKSKELINAKNFYLLRREVAERVSDPIAFQGLPLDGVGFERSVVELAESMENSEQIRRLYKLRKKTTGSQKNSGINESESQKLKNCFRQGRELYNAGAGGSLMVKPLNFFYAATAYAYGIIVLNNPIRYSKDNLPSSHGMTFIPDSVQAQFGGDSPVGTFSELFSSFPTQVIRNREIEIVQDCSASVAAFYEHKVTATIGTLLSMLPEMSDYYRMVTGQKSRTHPLEVVNANDPRSLVWEFQVGDGEHRPTREMVEQSFPDFDISERFGKYVIRVPANKASSVKAMIYTDIRGGLWFVENPFFPVLLPEVCLHFLITNVYSCIMRYRPDEWGSVLMNEISSDTSLLTRNYFSAFERKFFVMMLRSISRYYPHVK